MTSHGRSTRLRRRPRPNGPMLSTTNPPDVSRPRRVQELGTNLAYAEPGAAPGPIAPAVCNLTGMTNREGGQRLAAEQQAILVERHREGRIEPHEPDEPRVGEEHRVERPGQPEPEHTEGREPRRHDERPPREQQPPPRPERVPELDERPGDGPDQQQLEQHGQAVGASVLSRIALSAWSAVTPSSSSSGATLTRCRSTAGASSFTSSGMT